MGRIDDVVGKVAPIELLLTRRGVSKQVELMLEAGSHPSGQTVDDYLRVLPTTDQIIAALEPYEGDLGIQIVVVDPAVGLATLPFSPIEGRTYPINPDLTSITDNYPRPETPYLALVSMNNPNDGTGQPATALETAQFFIQNRVTIDALSAAGSTWPALPDSGSLGFTPLLQNSRPPHMCPISMQDKETPFLSVRSLVTRDPVLSGRRGVRKL